LQLFVSPAPTAGNVISTEDVHSFTVNRAVESPRISLSTQNKSQKVGAFFNTEKVSPKTPHPPHISPQTDHQNTKFAHPISQKPPAKTTNPSRN
jgi:hypothetical protein